MEVIHRRCAGLDVHKRSISACVRMLEGTSVRKEVRQFGTMTDDLRMLGDWLAAQGVTHLAMESTGVFWKPIFNVLGERFQILLCNAQHVKQVPGRKTDVKDSEWLAQLLQHGLLRGSFIPSRPQRDLRDLTRARTKIVEQRVSVGNRIQKELEDANIKLASVASDTLGASGRAMIEALIGGQQDPAVLANLARHKLRAKIPQLQRALDGAVSEHHRFMLELFYSQWQELTRHIEALDARIRDLTGSQAAPAEEGLPLFEPQATPEAADDLDEPPDPPGAARPSPSPTIGDSPAPTHRHMPPLATPGALALLTTIPGVSTRVAEGVLAEVGTDVSQFPTRKHLASWAGLCSGSHESAGKRKSGKTSKGNRWVRSLMVQAAWAAVRTKGTYLQAQFRRLSSKRGKQRAIVAVAHTMLTMIYVMLERHVPYHELGADYFDRRNSDTVTRRLVARLEGLGHKVTLEPSQPKAA